MSMLITLTPAESKRLIGKGLAAHPEIQRVMKKGKMLISGGTTTGYFVQELLHENFPIEHFPCGIVTQNVLCTTPTQENLMFLRIEDGEAHFRSPGENSFAESENFIRTMGPGDVFVKGANALDREDNIGFLLANPVGGTILQMLPKMAAQKIPLFCPIGLEKLVASVPDAARHMKGVYDYSFTTGKGCGYITVNTAVVIHELTALEILTGIHGTHVASGGFGGAEGAVTLVLEGNEEQEKRTAELIRKVKGEPALPSWKMKCTECSFRCEYRFPTKQG